MTTHDASSAAATQSDPVYDPDRMAALRATCLLDAPRDPAFDRLTDLAARLLKVPVALVTLIDEGRQFFAGSTGLQPPYSDTRETPLTHSLCQHVVRSDELLMISDAREHDEFRHHGAIETLGVIAYCGVPLRTAEGLCLGTVCAIDIKPHEWTQDDVSVLNDLAQAAMAEVQLRIHANRLEAQNDELDEQAAELTRALHDREMQVSRLSSAMKTNMLPAAVAARLLQLDRRLPSELRGEVDTIRRSIKAEGELVRELMLGPGS